MRGKLITFKKAAKDIMTVLRDIPRQRKRILQTRVMIREQIEYPSEEQEKLLEQIDRDFKIILRRGEIAIGKAKGFNVRCQSSHTIKKLHKELVTYLTMTEVVLRNIQELSSNIT